MSILPDLFGELVFEVCRFECPAHSQASAAFTLKATIAVFVLQALSWCLSRKSCCRQDCRRRRPIESSYWWYWKIGRSGAVSMQVRSRSWIWCAVIVSFKGVLCLRDALVSSQVLDTSSLFFLGPESQPQYSRLDRSHSDRPSKTKTPSFQGSLASFRGRALEWRVFLLPSLLCASWLFHWWFPELRRLRSLTIVRSFVIGLVVSF